jgi:hypothetical protein
VYYYRQGYYLKKGSDAVYIDREKDNSKGEKYRFNVSHFQLNKLMDQVLTLKLSNGLDTWQCIPQSHLYLFEIWGVSIT